MNPQESQQQKYMTEAKKYYHDAPSTVWDIHEVKRRVYAGNALNNKPSECLLGETFNGYTFYYRGIPLYFD